MEVVENRKEYLKEFIRLNEEWISTYFSIEDVDRALAADPYQIIENGGYIFSLVTSGEVLGVCALFNENNGVFELARMAVAPNHQGKGYSNRLIEACFKKLNDVGAHRVYLVSNTKLKAAISLYKKYGFNVILEGKHPVYSRANIVMERHVS
ncbi:MAG TPA: GNAT family N-acetyltransferase [Spongiibacteraceae bacterium]|jgi:N-acetylglutamate synthase-like GNAT family acetyltransferase